MIKHSIIERAPVFLGFAYNQYLSYKVIVEIVFFNHLHSKIAGSTLLDCHMSWWQEGHVWEVDPWNLETEFSFVKGTAAISSPSNKTLPCWTAGQSSPSSSAASSPCPCSGWRRRPSSTPPPCSGCTTLPTSSSMTSSTESCCHFSSSASHRVPTPAMKKSLFTSGPLQFWNREGQEHQSPCVLKQDQNTLKSEL